jgi:hypothetical protein
VVARPACWWIICGLSPARAHAAARAIPALLAGAVLAQARGADAVEGARTTGATDATDAADAVALAPEAGRLELQLGVGRRDETLAAGMVRATADGSALSDAALAGAWFGRGRLGADGRLAVERYALATTDTSPGANRVDVTGWSAAGGVAARAWALDGRLVLTGRLGYSFVQIPVALLRRSTAGLVQLAGGSLRGHGPMAGAALAFTGAGDRVGLELAADAVPVAFGASYDGVSVTPRRFGARLTATLGRLDAGGARWCALLLADFTRGVADGHDGAGAVSLRQSRAGVGLGVRARWLELRAPAPAPPPLRLLIQVRERVEGPGAGETTAAGPVAGIAIRVAGGPTLTTDREGAAVLEGLPPGPVALRLAGPGFEAADEVVAFPARGEARADLLITRAGARRDSAISGLVRSEDGAPLAAEVRILELGLVVTADAGGGFRFDVPPGSYTLSIRADGHVGQHKQVQAGRDQQQIYNVDLQRVRP